MSILLSAFASQRRRHCPLLLLLAVVSGAWGLFAEVAHELREDRRQPDYGFPFDRPVLDYLHQHAGHGRCELAEQLSALSGPLWLGVYALTLGGCCTGGATSCCCLRWAR